MGHGVRDESSSTKLYFVTAGYLVRLLAYHPEAFRSHTHLVIDEVHERSIDGDLLCMLAKRLLRTHPTLKVILMSATMEIGLYQEYFASPDNIYGSLECVSVGARRFPVQILYSEDITGARNFPRLMEACALKVSTASSKLNSSSTVPQQFPKDQYTLAYNIIRETVAPGTGVLIFVSGVNDIVELSALFANQDQYVVVPLHSEIPVEDQDIAFSAVDSHQVKVVIATNIAESSITLPDVDVVICLGTHKIVQYDQRTNRVQLVNAFISKASAAQRAGRTGRTRPGTVYRLYSKRLYGDFNNHDPPEVLRFINIMF
jgi:ATP-dependent RNA helicase DHX57